LGEVWKERPVISRKVLPRAVLFVFNRKKILAQHSEMKRALKSKETTSKDSAVDTKVDAPTGEAKLSPQDAQAIKQSGMVWDGVKRAYKKPLGDGKTFYFYDPKTKRRWKEAK